jgi:MOSC domain-containing protein YiiM
MGPQLSALYAGLDEIRRSPIDDGKIELVVRRPAENQREILTRAYLDTGAGLVGDGWLNRSGDPDRQVTLMNARAAALFAQSRERWPLAGDQLYVDLDLSKANLPPGTRLMIGSAVVEISAEPHRGCKKFVERFGLDALRLVNSQQGYSLNLRGLNARVIQPGPVRPGDTIGTLGRAVAHPRVGHVATPNTIS